MYVYTIYIHTCTIYVYFLLLTYFSPSSIDERGFCTSMALRSTQRMRMARLPADSCFDCWSLS